MKIGIGLPASIPGVRGELLLEWARKADAASFSSLGIIDRLVYSNFEPLTTLSVVAGVTHRIRLMTTVLLAPCALPVCWQSRLLHWMLFPVAASRWVLVLA